MPAPIPVPSAMNTKFSMPRATPRQCSPIAAMLASLSRNTGIRKVSSNSRPMSSSRHPGTLLASTTLPVCGSTPPGTPIAMPRKVPSPFLLWISLAIPSRICAMTPRGPASECTRSRDSFRICPSTLASTKRRWLAPMSMAIPQPADSGISCFARKLNSRPELRLSLNQAFVY